MLLFDKLLFVKCFDFSVIFVIFYQTCTVSSDSLYSTTSTTTTLILSFLPIILWSVRRDSLPVGCFVVIIINYSTVYILNMICSMCYCYASGGGMSRRQQWFLGKCESCTGIFKYIFVLGLDLLIELEAIYSKWKPKN